jgi:dihydroorotase
MVDTYESLNERFPILDVVIKHLTCNDAEKGLLKELFVTVYGVGYSDGQSDR